MIGYYSLEELTELGFGSIGNNVKISKTTTIYNTKSVFIASNVRIDNFCVLAISGNAKLVIGNHVHISAFCFFNGLSNIILEDFVTIAPYVGLYSSTDDYSGKFMTGATVEKEFLGTLSKDIFIKKHCIIGPRSTLTPGVKLGIGSAVGAHSFVKNSFDDFSIIAGTPAKFIKPRFQNILELEKKIQ